MYQARRRIMRGMNKVFFSAYRKAYKKSRWQKAYSREVKRIKAKFFKFIITGEI